LPHAILISGPRGIGKATLAFRFARFVLAGGGAPAGLLDDAEGGLAIDPGSGVFRRVAAGGHADLLTVERAYDARRRRLHGEILVEHAREIAGFLRLTAAEEGWRVVVVDAAEEMNRAAANAVLKILEEPPRRALLLLVSHSPGQLLPTIRSRCRQLPLAALARPLVMRLLARYCPELAPSEAEAVAALAGGSIGRALDLVEADGLALYRSMIDILSRAPRIDVTRLHRFAEEVAGSGAEDAYRTGEELVLHFLARMVVGAARARLGSDEIVAGEGEAMRRLAACADPARWAALREDIKNSFARAEQLNLDRKHAVLSAFFAIERMAS
jgi:DNA polymerase III subunit delta'